MLEKVSGLGFRVLDKKGENSAEGPPGFEPRVTRTDCEKGPTLPDVHVVKEDK